MLVVEDNLVNQLLAQAHLEGLGHAVTLIDNGQAALAVLADEVFDVVLMDCQMPVMDGLDATRHLRALERQQAGRRHLPVVALTASAMKEDRDRCLAAGMDDFLSKPFNGQELNEVLARAVKAKVATAPVAPAKTEVEIEALTALA